MAHWLLQCQEIMTAPWATRVLSRATHTSWSVPAVCATRGLTLCPSHLACVGRATHPHVEWPLPGPRGDLPFLGLQVVVGLQREGRRGGRRRGGQEGREGRRGEEGGGEGRREGGEEGEEEGGATMYQSISPHQIRLDTCSLAGHALIWVHSCMVTPVCCALHLPTSDHGIILSTPTDVLVNITSQPLHYYIHSQTCAHEYH